MKVDLMQAKKDIILKNITESDLEFFKELLEAETIGENESIIKEQLITKLKELQFSIEVDDIGNISAVRGKADEYPMLNAHMDIVDYSWYGAYNNKKSSSYGSYSYDDSYATPYCYNNGYDLYETIYDIIENTRQKHDIKEVYLKEIIAKIQPYFNELGCDELDCMGVDCLYCKNTCMNTFVCEKFTLAENNNSLVEQFIDKLESHCLSVIEEFESYYYEEFEEDIDNNEERNELYQVVIDLKENKIKGKGKCRVLGGDDKCGVFIALKVAELLPDLPLKILFTVQEESGCIGISHFIDNNLEFFSDVKYSLTIDRREGDNLLWSQCDERSCSNNFAAKLAREGVKVGIPIKIMDGNVADVIHIRNHVPNSVNMSAGYYRAHSDDEYIVPSEVDNIIEWVKNILINV